MKLNRHCIVFTGGGSGGHVYPGLAVIEQLRASWQGRIVWIGSGKAVEREAVEKAGVEFLPIPSGKFRRALSLRNFFDLFRVVAGYFHALHHLSKLRPCLVFSKGGYVSVPPCAAAATLGIPYFTHESDVTPGLATRINARKAHVILVSWQETLAWLQPHIQRKTIVCGNPVRAAIASGNAANGRQLLGCPEGRPLVLVLGGSQGASQVNELVAAALPSLRGKIFVAHQTGASGQACQPADEWYKGFDFLHGGMADAYAAATLIAGRAGAGTVWETTAAGKPLLLIPLSGSGTRGDQVHNAGLLEAAGAAKVLIGEKATPENFSTSILDFLDVPQQASAMVAAARALINPNAANDIANLILSQSRM